MRHNKFLLCCGLVLLCSSVLAMNFNEGLKNYQSSDQGQSSWTSWFSSSKADEKAGESATATLPEGDAYVRVSTALNIRTGPWGKITGWFSNNDKVKIIGREGDWYKISYNGETRYIHSRYVSASKSDTGSSGSSSSSSDALVTAPGSGSLQAKLVNSARNLVTKYSRSGSFPYAPATKGGSLGCAQVATTALMNAGVNTGIQLGVLATIPKLKALGWKEVKVPPYQAGDVITWSTYDRTGDGRKDPDTHIGIVLQSGNSVQAMSNSSSRKVPAINSATYCPVSRVLRHA
ncbi:MAG: SH3 domain-containing protein [Candidatus Riflebacteria bacterium]|nr:SH3 domain-containing protein [Candidatus Riflebacteria bacterium]